MVLDRVLANGYRAVDICMLQEADVRKLKLQTLIDAGIDPYPSTTARNTSCAEARTSFDAFQQADQSLILAGRLLITRIHGGILFADLQDQGGKIQIAVKQDVVGEPSFALFRDTLDPGDFVEVTGTLFLTKRGEKTLQVNAWKVLAKALLPLPEKWHGLADIEQRFRKRYLDLLLNADVRERMLVRSKVISAIRALLDGRGFLEVETPTLQPIYGGGFARPFVTHHHALESDFYLRISDEMYLKRLLVGGFERVYEITKVFRNEGIDHDHNPEFTMFEAQIAYQDYRFGMDLFEEIFETAALQAKGTTEIEHGDQLISVKRPWRRLRLADAVREIGGVDPDGWRDLAEAKTAIRERLKLARKREELERLQTMGEVLAFAFEELVEEKLIQPTIIFDYPVEVSPLAKKCTDPRFTQRFEAFALGSEIGNNYSELNDPVDLEQRFMHEKKKEAAGFDEAHQTDRDYLEAIQHGMPPACGLGIGIDILVMLFTNSHSIRDVLYFPLMKPQE